MRQRASKCPHHGRVAHAFGLCSSCYNRWAIANSPRYAEAKKKIHQRASFKKHYGITLEHYESLLKAQDGLCAICRTHTTKKRLAVDHDHATGKVRGLLCHRCNVGIGQFKESAELLDKAKAYLARLDTSCPTDPAAPTNSVA